MESLSSLALALAAGVAIAAACGLRAFLPLLAVGMAGRFLHVPLSSAAEWLEGDLVLLALAVATVAEIAGDKIPVVDHGLDAIGTAICPAAAVVASYALLDRLAAPWSAIVPLMLGGGALLVHGAKAKLRIGSTAVTLGVASPILSLLEDGTALAIVLAALLAPLIALIGTGALFWLIVRGARRRGRPRPPAA